MSITCLAGSGNALANLPNDFRQSLEISHSPAVSCSNDFSVAANPAVTATQFDMNLGVA
ncbi:MAG: hypothetical protein JKY11_02030 [Alphaproteobacteria bacterium]|nr:hypothetical protein [Alphaproteobacteria bacterium]